MGGFSDTSTQNICSENTTNDASVRTDRPEDGKNIPNLVEEANCQWLPIFRMCSSASFQWGQADPVSVASMMTAAFDEVVRWKRNLFRIPAGSIGKSFVRELSAMFQSYNEGSGMESVAIYAAMIMPALLLQKTGPQMKLSEMKKCLERRMNLWNCGSIDELLAEAKVLQQRATIFHQKEEEDLARRFANLIFQGKIKDALRLISTKPSGHPLPPNFKLPNNKTVFEELCHKHPEGKSINPSVLISEDECTTPFHPVIFDALDGALIKEITMKTKGSAGPSGLDAEDWRHMCCSFKEVSNQLCNTLAGTAQRIATTYVDPKGLEALNACRLIALDKRPGVRPIGVGEVVKMIIGKAILRIVKEDIRKVVGPIQLCAGFESGAEIASITMQTLFDDDGTEAVLLVNAENAFNSLNRKVVLVNILRSCPSIAPALINNYRTQPKLYIQDHTVLSEEGTTQGDPMAMAMYALSIAPLVKKCAGVSTQVWYADDLSAGGTVDGLCSWWERLAEDGPLYGTSLRRPNQVSLSRGDMKRRPVMFFFGSGIAITTEGNTHLGIPLGTDEYQEQRFRE